MVPRLNHMRDHKQQQRKRHANPQPRKDLAAVDPRRDIRQPCRREGPEDGKPDDLEQRAGEDKPHGRDLEAAGDGDGKDGAERRAEGEGDQAHAGVEATQAMYELEALGKLEGGGDGGTA